MNKVERFPKPVRTEPIERSRLPTLGEIGLDHFAPYLLNRITARWNSDLSVELKEHNLNTIQMRTLAVLSIMSGATVNELSVYTVTEQSTMSRSLDGMEREGMVRRQARPGDMRVREVHITEAGREVFRRFWPTMHTSFERMFEGISDGEYEVLIRLLTRVLKNIRKNEI
jgi:MarR family transcriptional regulator, transcriptional regulator for hemolysin